jgi:hypothetical protein
MKNDFEYKTFLFISVEKLVLTVLNSNQKNLFKKELLIKDVSNELNLNIINDFLNKNIFEVEKILNSFVNNIFLIIDYKDFFSIEVSLKKNNYGEIFDFDDLSNLLREAKDQCKKTLENQQIVHMKIENYIFDETSYSYLPKNLHCNYISLDINFICISKSLILDLEKILKNYQISVNKVISYNYLANFLNPEIDDIFHMGEKILNGYNKNEVLLVNKTHENKGFFEKFFNFFS